MPALEVNEVAAPVCYICQDIHDKENRETDSPCKKCHGFYCHRHTSKLQADHCDNCLRITDVAPKVEPLLDEDGVHHEGRRIVLSGEFWMSMQLDIIQMSETELENHVNALRAAVREIELLRDYRQIALSHSENELEQRKLGRYRKLRLLKDHRAGKITAGNVTEMKRRAAKPKTLEQIMAAGGLTQEQLLAALQMAAKMQKK